MKSLSLAVMIVLSSLLVEHGAPDGKQVKSAASSDGTAVPQPSTVDQPSNRDECSSTPTTITEPNLAGASHGNSSNTTPSQIYTKAPGGSHNSTSPESEISGGGSWVWVVCVIAVILFLIPVILLFVPSFRQRIKFFPASAATGMSAHQEMPQTKQDVTEIQWDLAWMEMANLLDKQHYPGS